MKKDKVMFIVDFGLAKEYIDPDTNKHIPYRCNIIIQNMAMVTLMTNIGQWTLNLSQGAQVTDRNCSVHVDQHSPG